MILWNSISLVFLLAVLRDCHGNAKMEKIAAERKEETIEALVKFTELLSGAEDLSSGSGEHISDGKFHTIKARFLVLPNENNLTNTTNQINKTSQINATHSIFLHDNSNLGKNVTQNAKEYTLANNITKEELALSLLSNNKPDLLDSFRSHRPSALRLFKSNNSALEIMKLSYQPTERIKDRKKYLRNKDMKVGVVKYNHKKKNKSSKKSTNNNGVHGTAHKSSTSYYKVLMSPKQVEITDKRIRDFKKNISENIRIANMSSINVNTTLDIDSPGSKLNALNKNVTSNFTVVNDTQGNIAHGQQYFTANYTNKRTGNNTGFFVSLTKEDKEKMKKSQNFLSTTVTKSLETLRFKNGASGKVQSGQEFAYISQCGLYTEPQNVSSIQHSWVTKTYSPYFYLYEKPKKYEMCKTSAWMNGTDLRGSVFLSFEVKSIHGSNTENNAKICEKYCCKEPRCAAWVLRRQKDATANCPTNSYCCWLKTDVPHPEPHENCVSGKVHREHYRHPPVGMRSSVPLGGLGTGSFELRADGTFHEWTIENQSPGGAAKFSKTSLEMLMLGVRVQHGSKLPKSAVLRTHAPHGFDSTYSQEYFGSSPVSKLSIVLEKSIQNDVKLDLYAFSTFHPRKPKEAATPSVSFVLRIENPSTEEMDVSFMMNLPFGYHEDTIRRGNNFAEIAFTRLVTAADCQNACQKKEKCMAWTTNGPFSCMLKDAMPLHSYEYGIISGLKGVWSVDEKMLNCKRPGFFPQSGDISMFPIDYGSEVNSFVVDDDPEVIWKNFKETGHVSNRSCCINETGLNGAVSTRTVLKPKETKLLTIVFAWYFPNRDIADERVGNFYNNLFQNSIEVAEHTSKDIRETLENVLKWQATILPPESLHSPSEENKLKKKHKQNGPRTKSIMNGVNILPESLQDILINSLSTLRSGMWMENGRWRQWEAFDCANMDPVHVDFHRIIPYIIFYPAIAKEVMLAWADHQLTNGMIQESLSMGCLEETSKEGVAGGRLMTDVNVGFIVQALLIYKWTNDTVFFNEIYPYTKRATAWLMNESTKGTNLPYRKPDTYDLFDLEKYDHCSYNSVMYILALHAMKTMANMKNEEVFLSSVKAALDRAMKQFDIEMWDESKLFYHAWFDDEYGSPPWLMSDSLYGQVWAYTLGLGDLLEHDKIKKHLHAEFERNDTPFGLKVISKSEVTAPTEDTSVILGDELNSCKSLENITKSESIWMSSSSDWTSLQLHLGLNPHAALEQAVKSLDNYRATLRDQWNFHGLTSSKSYGLDGLPWATSHYTFHLVLWHIPLALSGQQYDAITGSLTFDPKFEVPYWLPFYTPYCMGNIEAKEQGFEEIEILYSLSVTSGACNLQKLSVSEAVYGRNHISIHEGDTVQWSTPKKTKKEIVSDMLSKLK